MYTSQSFSNNDVLISNVPGAVSPLGELSPWAKTFSRELGIYADPAVPQLTLMTFRSVSDENSPTPAAVVMPPDLVNQSIALMNFIWNVVLTTSGQLFHDQLLQQLVTYSATHDMNSIELGPVVNRNGRWAPNWVAFKSELLADDNHNKIWLANESFETEYAEYEIVVVPPLEPIDNFFQPGSMVETAVKAITIPDLVAKMNAFRDKHPTTIDRVDNYTYVNPLNSIHRFPVPWPVLIYGPAGDNVDAIKDALVTYILANSAYTREDWTKIFPDIFKRTEFMIVPHWHKYAIPNMTLGGSGVYSSISNNKEATALLQNVVPSYDDAFIADHAHIFSHTYKSLTLGCVGSAENRDQLFELIQVMPDYISVSTSSPDFIRMAEPTREWSIMIGNLLVIAETMSEFTTMPQGTMKMTREGILFVVKTYDNIQYLVMSRKSLYEKLGIDPNFGG